VKIAEFVAQGLREAGYSVMCASDGVQGWQALNHHAFEMAIVDIMLPGIDGITLIERMRGAGIITPVLILSAKRSLDDRVRGLQSGGDDYLTKPFAFTELLARVQSLIRRSTMTADPMVITVGDLVLDMSSMKVFRGDVEIELQPREFALLKYLMRNAGKVVSRTMIMERVWDYNFLPGTNVVDVQVCRLREKIDRDFNTRLIHTVRGAGYVLKEGK